MKTMAEKILTLSFCITCMNRFQQIQKTLPKNLEDNRSSKEYVEFILVDFGSTDGLQEWITLNFMDEIDEGYLKYFYTEELMYWHASVAKNTAHMLSNNNILVNLDCDNYTGFNGGVFILNNMLKYGFDNTIIHQFSNEYDGSYGRIAIIKNKFIEMGGYDENFEPMGYQDADLILRLCISGTKYIHLVDKEYNKTIRNTKEDSMINTGSNISWAEMNHLNYTSSRKNITSGILSANAEKPHIGIVENVFTFLDE